MPDRFGFNGPFADGTRSCIECGVRGIGLSERERERHQKKHERERREAAARRQREALRVARQAKRLADRENALLQERGLY